MKYAQTPWKKKVYEWDDEIMACTIEDANGIELLSLEFFEFDDRVDRLADFIIDLANKRGYPND